MGKEQYRLIGVMSGTSLDGVDLVFTEINFNNHVDFSIIALTTKAPRSEACISFNEPRKVPIGVLAAAVITIFLLSSLII